MITFDSVTNIASVGLVLLTAVLFLLFSIQFKTPFQDTFRPIPALARLRQAVFAAVENGTRVHLSLGKASIVHSNAASSLVGLNTLASLVRLTSYCDRPPLATSGESTMSILGRDTLRAAYRTINLSDTFDPYRSRLAGLSSFSYSAGLLPVIFDEHASTHIFCGNFSVDVSLALEMMRKEKTFILAASDSLPAQAVMFASTPDALIGEELFALPAALHPERFQVSSLMTQDTLRWLIIVFLILGAILKISGMEIL
ncbi:MAG: DUF6754 domain-containing protein [Anaerolineaceae bacterium]